MLDHASFSQEDGARRGELARFLRASRERLNPAEAAGGQNRRRRAKGWLREEVAAAAGISATWYMWLEQARDVRASRRALTGLARALRLDGPKTLYLFSLARPDLSLGAVAGISRQPSAALAGFIDGLSPMPAYVLDARWDIVARNPAADFLFGGIDTADKWSCNLVARLFGNAVMRARMPDWEQIVTSSVGQFRAATADLAGDREHLELIAALAASDALFKTLWESHRIDPVANWDKRFALDGVGLVTFRYQSLRPSGEDDPFRVTIYSPASPIDNARFTAAFAGAVAR